MVEPEVIAAVSGAVGGGGLTYAIAHFAIKNAFGDLRKVVTKIHELDKAVTAICVHVKTIAMHEKSIKDIAQRLAFIEGRNDRKTKAR